jgi:hypothetical protein
MLRQNANAIDTGRGVCKLLTFGGSKRPWRKSARRSRSGLTSIAAKLILEQFLGAGYQVV